MSSQQQTTPWAKLEHFPVSFFAMIMGTTGLTLVWQKAASLLHLPMLISQLLLTAVIALFISIIAAYGYKLYRYPGAVQAEFQHPVKISFFPAFSLALVLLSIAVMPSFPAASLWLWVTGASLHLLLTLYVIGQWIFHPKYQVQHSTPAWFIPVVGNIAIPLAGVEHGFYEISWFFFAIGLVYWLILKTLIFNRMMFHDPLPEKLLPTLFILVAPPAVGFLAYMKLNGGDVDTLARIFFYSALFLLLFLLSQANRFRNIAFYMSWWAYSFPLAAATMASMVMYQHNPHPGLKLLSYVLLVLVTAVITTLVWRTWQGLRSGKLLQPD